MNKTKRPPRSNCDTCLDIWKNVSAARSNSEINYDDFVQLLRALNQEAWKFYAMIPKSGISIYQECKTFKKTDVIKWLDLASKFNMPLVMTGVGFGFGRIGIAFYSNEIFPGDESECLFILSENHLDEKDCPWINEPTKGNVHKKTWELFSKYTHSENNKNRLKFSNLPAPKDIIDFCY